MIKLNQQLSKVIISILITCTLSGCASLFGATPKNSEVPLYTRPVKVDNDFDISGRFSIKSDNTNKYGNFSWLKLSNTEDLEFNTPLGQTVAKITITNGVATLVADNRTYTSSDLDSMMQEKLGFVLPLSYLHYWVQGVALPDIADTKALPSGFSQLGWNVEYLKWKDVNHPQIIQLTHENLVIKLLIDW